MGFLVQGQCFASFAEAVDHYWTLLPRHSVCSPSVMPQCVHHYAVKEPAGLSGVWKLKTDWINQSGVITNRYSVGAPAMAFPECDANASFFDGMALGWLLVGVMVIGWGAKKIREQLR